MKRILFILFLVPVIANAQRPNDMPFRYNFADSVYLGKFTASLPLKLNVNKSVYSAKITVSESDTAVGAGIAGWLRLQKHADSLGALISAKMTNPMSTTGDIIYSSSGSTPARLGIGSNGQYLSVISGVPAWVSLSSTFSYGTYTPTVTEITNGGGASLTVAYVCQFMKVGTTVTVSGKIDIDPASTSTLTEIKMTLPVSSNFSAPEQAGGTGADGVNNNVWKIVADAASDAVYFIAAPNSAVVGSVNFSFTYQVI